jgi:hypothetical protein
MVHLDFKATNNMAKYEALLFGLSIALSLGVRQLVVKGECCYNDPQLAAYLLHARKLEKDFEVLDLQHILRVENAVVDDMSTKASTSTPIPDGVLERQLRQPIARAADLSDGGETSTLKLVVPAVLVPWSLPRVIDVTGDSVHPGAQLDITQLSHGRDVFLHGV